MVGAEVNESIRLRQRFQERVTGEAAIGCPWRALYDDIVADVVELSRAVGDGALVSVLALKPPHHLWEALLLYRRVADLTERQNDEDDRNEKLRQSGGDS